MEGAPLVDARSQAGIGRYVASLLNALHARSDVSVTVATPAGGPWRESPPLRWLNSQPSLFVDGRFRPDVVHATGSEPALVSTPGRQVVTVHDVIPWTEPDGGGRLRTAYLAYQRRRLQRCGAVIVVGDAVARAATRVLGLDPHRVHVVPEGVDPVFAPGGAADDDELRRAAGVVASEYVMWVGSLRAHDPRKALDHMLAAVATAGPLPLALVGAGGPEAERVEARARDLGVQVVLTGFVSDRALAALYRGATALVVPSRDEGFGLPLLEALACGAPVVASAAGNLPDLAGGAAVLVPPGDAGALGVALAKLLGDERTRARLKKLGPTVAAPYTWARAAEMTAAVYRTVAAEQS